MLASIAARLTRWLHAVAAAVQFLTRFPLPVRVNFTGAVLVRSTIFYPVAGWAIGVVLAVAAAILAAMGLQPLLSAALLLALWTALTGGLHLDGLMDTADGVLSHRSRERMLEIMKDSRVGAMGVIVCVLYLLLKFALLYTNISSQEPGRLWVALLLAPIWSRWTMVLSIAVWPYARAGTDQGSNIGSLFQGVGTREVAAAAVLAIVASLTLGAAGSPFPQLAWQLIVSALTALAAGCFLSAWLAKKLGGLTGDTYGAVNEISEITVLLALILMQTSG